MNRFVAHGEFNFRREGKLFHIDFIGDWNKEQALAFAMHAKKTNDTLNLTYFSNLITFTNFGITHDAIPIMNAVTSAAIKQGLLREALIFNDSWSKQLTVDFGAKSHGHYQRKIFDDKQKALDWLKESYPD